MIIRLKKQKAKNVEKLIKTFRNTFCLFVASLKLGCRFISLLLSLHADDIHRCTLQFVFPIIGFCNVLFNNTA